MGNVEGKRNSPLVFCGGKRWLAAEVAVIETVEGLIDCFSKSICASGFCYCGIFSEKISPLHTGGLYDQLTIFLSH